ncbi:hypothetical protein FH972_020774 [Carpinus fangiana]|uniref:DUF4220 domain-containing protein n=1 Tax=Carpinus fangiana TaxID=176857 RepID=A0A5N6RUA3_9ROSI|nr:hypothetical protein FH972_020774 [Carpinus fangiana]
MVHLDPVPGQLKGLWDEWGIDILVLVSFTLQTILALCGNRRRYIPGFWIRFTVWFTYLLTGSVAKVIIGKLSAIEIRDTKQDNVRRRELEALLAPLLLVQLGNPDAITAYSIEDNKLGLRQLLNLVFQVGIVVYILIRCWTSTPISFLYLPMFLAGIIKYGELAWALKSALRNSGITTEEIIKEANVPALFRKLPRDIPGLELIVKAYYRFDCFKPHLENWFYKPFHESLSWMSIDAYSAEDMFKIIDAELGFMYDVLYTKAPIIYTRTGCILRIISFFSLASTLCGFTIQFKKKGILQHWDAGYTFFLLIITIILEVYQIILLPFSDWAIIQMIKHHNMPVMMQCLQFLGPKACKWKRWSNSLGQFNLLSFCLHDKQLKLSRIIKFCGKDMEFRKITNKKRVGLPKVLKEVIVQELKEVDQVRDPSPITQRGQWALERHGCLNQFLWSVKRNFDKSITIWHIATDICYDSDIVLYSTANSYVEMSKLLSNYMMYLLALRPHMLCTTTADVIFHHSYTKLMMFLRTGPSIIRDEHNACRILRTEELAEESNFDRNKESIVTSNWNVLQDAQKLAKSLMGMENRWIIISSVWVEMLCYAANNCPVDYHAEQLRRGGGLITHVWLLLAHKTEKFYTSD